MSPLPSCPSPPFWLFCGSSAPWRPPPQTTDTKRRAAKLGLILVCAGSEWAAYCEKPSRACMEMPGRPFTRGPCPGQPCSAHPPPHPEWCAPIAPPLLCWHSTTFCTFQPSSDSWERIVRLFGRLINFDKQLTECNPGSASLSLIQFRSVSSREPWTRKLDGSMIFCTLQQSRSALLSINTRICTDCTAWKEGAKTKRELRGSNLGKWIKMNKAEWLWESQEPKRKGAKEGKTGHERTNENRTWGKAAGSKRVRKETRWWKRRWKLRMRWDQEGNKEGWTTEEKADSR